MLRIRTTFHDPVRLRQALAGATHVVLDLETTGLLRTDRITAVGVLVDRDAYILVTDQHRDLSSLGHRVGETELRMALEPLATRLDLIAILHNATFDVGMLERVGINVRCQVHDTLKLLKLIDCDRGAEGDDGQGTGSQRPRFDRRFQEATSYKLKDVARHLLGRRALDFPGQTMMLAMPILVRYLKSDLIVTSELYQALQQRLSLADRDYNCRLIAPLTPLLVQMTVNGVQADSDFIKTESSHLLALMGQISDAHAKQFGQKLDVGDFALRGWVYFRGLRCRRMYSGKKRMLSVKTEHLQELIRTEGAPATRESLALIHDYKLVQGLMQRLRSLDSHVEPVSGRIFSTFNDFQASGRISSTYPNLQQIAREVGPGQKKKLLSQPFRELRIKSRNAIVATAGFELVAFDIAQADIRVLAHAVKSFRLNGAEYLRSLEARRNRRLRQRTAKYRMRMWDYYQPQNKKPVKCPHCWTVFRDPLGPRGSTVPCPACSKPLAIPDRSPVFDATRPCELAEDFRASKADFYTTASERMLGRKPAKGTSERDHLKQTILGMVNGMGAASLAKRLLTSKETANEYIDTFARTYTQVALFTELMKHGFAMLGTATTFAGRRRRSTAHWWLVNKAVVDIFISYKGADKLWVRVVPLQPGRHTLTCWVLRVIDAKFGSPNEGQEIYNHRVGRISQAPYRFFDDSTLIFRLPVRNISWRNIRRVRTRNEEASYEGFDRASRQLFNHICQGGTADIAKTMMLRAEPVCKEFGARIVLQIHDEIVIEVPKKSAQRFTRIMKRTLEKPPSEDFRVPIVVEPKTGVRFGELRKVHPQEISSCWLVRLWYRIKQWCLGIRTWLRSGCRPSRARAGGHARVINHVP